MDAGHGADRDASAAIGLIQSGGERVIGPYLALMADPFHRLKEAMADRYTLERELGAGGMATVYLAHDPRHNRKVAIKVMNSELAAIIGAARFLKEIETPANLRSREARSSGGH